MEYNVCNNQQQQHTLYYYIYACWSCDETQLSHLRLEQKPKNAFFFRSTSFFCVIAFVFYLDPMDTIQFIGCFCGFGHIQSNGDFIIVYVKWICIVRERMSYVR